MNAFRFPLQKALEWRRTQLELAEARYRQQAAEVASLDRRRAEIEASGIRAELDVRRRGSVAGLDLAALDGFRRYVKNTEAGIARQRADAAQELSTRRQAMMEARRRSKLLERLRERRLDEWESTRDRELEDLAGESFLARWNRRD